MAAKLIEIHPAALAELKSAITWYFERSRAAAHKFANELDRGLDRIIESPQRWPKAELGTRKFVLRHFPFALVYRVNHEAVQILAVAHGHRQPGYWKSRL